MFNEYVYQAAESAVSALLWSELDEDDNPLNTTCGPEDVDSSVMRELKESIMAALEDERAWDIVKSRNISAGTFGFNFIMSANGPVAGFWDRGWGEDGDYLHELVKPCGSVSAYIADDGAVYIY